MGSKLFHAEDPSKLDFQIVDARPPGRFAGIDPEPRPGLRKGSMKGTLSVPFATVLNPDGTLKAEHELTQLFKDAGVDLKKNTVQTCGSGLTACLPDLAMSTLGHENAALYDASWSEYGKGDEP